MIINERFWRSATYRQITTTVNVSLWQNGLGIRGFSSTAWQMLVDTKLGTIIL